MKLTRKAKLIERFKDCVEDNANLKEDQATKNSRKELENYILSLELSLKGANKENEGFKKRLWRFEHPDGLENHPAYGM